MKQSDIKAIYAAKRKIRENNSKIISSIKTGDHSGLNAVYEQNNRLRRKIRERYGILLE